MVQMREKYGIMHADGPVMELTTMIGCPLMCTFCPQDNLRTEYGTATKYMTQRDLTTMLVKLPRNTRIDFSGMAEPWANPECTSMLEEVLYMGFNVAVYTTLYGMTPDHARKVKQVLEAHPKQVEVIMLHLPDANKNMKGWKPTTEWMNTFEIFTTIQVPCGLGAMTMDKSGIVHPDLQPIVGQLAGWVGHTRADSLDVEQIKGQLISITPHNEFSLTCRSTPFYDRNVLLPDGSVVLCCMDYNLTHVLGNLLTQTYDEIMQGKPLQDLITLNEAPEFNKCSICKSCENVRKI
jgi:sulfatase maturation enzyme AslB (radical SAM superfamily)